MCNLISTEGTEPNYYSLLKTLTKDASKKITAFPLTTHQLSAISNTYRCSSFDHSKQAWQWAT